MISLRLAGSLGLNTVAFPSISTGDYGYPVEERLTALKVVKEFLENDGSLNLMVLYRFLSVI